MPVLERSKYVWQRRSEEQRQKVEMELWKYFLGRRSVSTGIGGVRTAAEFEWWSHRDIRGYVYHRRLGEREWLQNVNGRSSVILDRLCVKGDRWSKNGIRVCAVEAS